MKKAGILCSVVLLLSVILILLISVRTKEKKKEFEIFQIYTVQGGDYRKTSINAIVNIGDYNISEMCDKVKEEHERLNETSDKLLIRLFNSKKAWKEHICAGEKEYKDNKKRP